MTPAPLCLHCEKRPADARRGLCRHCFAVKGIRILYLRRRGWTPEWEAHLRRLTERARRRLPLFEDPPQPRPPMEADPCAPDP